jgi:hypothetical protein
MLAMVISGGQTGVDQAALSASRAYAIPTGGWAPKGWLTEDGPAPWLADSGLLEMPTASYTERTRANVEMATACLWFGNPHSPGGKLTLRLCREASLDHFVVIRESTPRDVALWLTNMVWLDPGNPEVLLVAGNRESKSPGIGQTTHSFLAILFALLRGLGHA